MHGQAGHMMFIDFADNSVTQVPADLASAGMELLVIDTRAPHQHTEGEYGARRQSCERACEILGVPSLRHISTEQLPAALETLQFNSPDGTDPKITSGQAASTKPHSSAAAESGEILARRVRHVVTENARVLDAVQNLKDGKLSALGPILTAGHNSLRDDYEVTVPDRKSVV